jgi:hypothetical protein
MLKSVLFPHPEGPTTQTKLPSARAKETGVRASTAAPDAANFIARDWTSSFALGTSAGSNNQGQRDRETLRSMEWVQSRCQFGFNLEFERRLCAYRAGPSRSACRRAPYRRNSRTGATCLFRMPTATFVCTAT